MLAMLIEWPNCYYKINVCQKTIYILPIWFIWILCSYSSVYQRAFIMPQDYYIRLILALSTNTLYTNTLYTNTLYEDASIIHFFVNRAYHFFDKNNTVKAENREWAHCSVTIWNCIVKKLWLLYIYPSHCTYLLFGCSILVHGMHNFRHIEHAK